MGRPFNRKPGEKYVPVGVRMPPELKALLEAEAEANDRNLSQECIRRLRMSFETNPPIDLAAKRRVA